MVVVVVGEVCDYVLYILLDDYIVTQCMYVVEGSEENSHH